MVACHRLSTGKKLTPLFLESEQLFVFNLSKLSWEFKPFVVAVNSTFFKSPASGRVSGSFNTGQTLVAKVGEKILPPSCFFPPGPAWFYSIPDQRVDRGCFTIEVGNTQGAPPDMASISWQQSSEWNQAGRCRQTSICGFHYPCTDLSSSTFSICSEWEMWKAWNFSCCLNFVKFQLLPQFPTAKKKFRATGWRRGKAVKFRVWQTVNFMFIILVENSSRISCKMKQFALLDLAAPGMGLRLARSADIVCGNARTSPPQTLLWICAIVEIGRQPKIYSFKGQPYDVHHNVR